MKKILTLTFSIFVLCFSVAQSQTVSIATARTMVGSTVTITGITISPSFGTTYRTYFIYDGTAGIELFRAGLTATLNVGDSVKITGVISVYNGLSEITAPDDASIIVLNSNNKVPKPDLVSIHDLNTFGENYESNLIAISNLNKVSGTWPTAAGNATLKMTDGKDTLTMFLDTDMGLYTSPEPTWPMDVIGVATQYAASGIGGYELQPRYMTDFLAAKTLPKAGSLISIDSARNSLNDTVKISGVVISPNYQTVNRSYYISNGTAGLDLFSLTLTAMPALNLGDSITVIGVPSVYNGLTEIQPLTDTTFATLIVKRTNAALPQPKVITVLEFNTNGEKYESQLITIKGLTKFSGSWPTSASSATLTMTDGTANLTLYLDSDMKLNAISEPIWPMDVTGVASQYASSGVGGYQLLGRLPTDFVPSTPLPVELTTFTVNATQKSAILNWATSTEKNNSGFAIERRLDGAAYEQISFVKGKGTSSENSKYSFIDNNLANGSYYYRLRQIDLNGASNYSKEVEVQISGVPNVFTLSQNYPNPFNPSTIINFMVEKPGFTSLKVFNALGQEVSTLFNSQATNGQVYSVTFNGSNLTSGIYFYQLKQDSQIKTQKMMLVK